MSGNSPPHSIERLRTITDRQNLSNQWWTSQWWWWWWSQFAVKRDSTTSRLSSPLLPPNRFVLPSFVLVTLDRSSFPIGCSFEWHLHPSTLDQTRFCSFSFTRLLLFFSLTNAGCPVQNEIVLFKHYHLSLAIVHILNMLKNTNNTASFQLNMNANTHSRWMSFHFWQINRPRHRFSLFLKTSTHFRFESHQSDKTFPPTVFDWFAFDLGFNRPAHFRSIVHVTSYSRRSSPTRFDVTSLSVAAKSICMQIGFAWWPFLTLFDRPHTWTKRPGSRTQNVHGAAIFGVLWLLLEKTKFVVGPTQIG